MSDHGYKSRANSTDGSKPSYIVVISTENGLSPIRIQAIILPNVNYFRWDPKEHISVKCYSNSTPFHLENAILYPR